jgi:HEAT repeat protein
MSQTCPICNKAVDPIRAPAVKVRAGKVVAFCSAECAKVGETQPTVMPTVTPTAMPAVTPKRRTPPAGVVVAPQIVDSGPVIEILHEPASGVVTSAKDERVPRPPSLPEIVVAPKPKAAPQKPKDDTLDKWTLTDEEVHEQSKRAATPLPMAPSRSRAPILIAVVLVLAGLGFLGYRYIYGKSSAKPDRSASGSGSAIEVPPAPVPPPPPPGPSLESSVDRAREVLKKHMHSDSPRVQRVAAAALARTGDKDAVAALVDVLAREASDVAKLDIGYALARGGDKRGGDALATAATSGRSRDVRAEASRLLALLGDQRAIPTLSSYLEVSQLRLGAAEQLAFIAEPRALKVLDQIRADAKSSVDDKARATIALGIAGRGDVAPALRELLSDGRFNAFAATALASLHDPAALPVLEGHLEIPSLRVGAARALRRLDPKLDAQPLLPPLLAALESGKDTEQVQVAEAVLLLAGPVEWSLHP